MEIICPNHGPFISAPSRHVIRKHGCPKCSGVAQSNTEEFINKARKIFGTLYDYTSVNYKNAKLPITINCSKHGDFFQRPNDHLTGYGCPKCSTNISNKEQRWLDSLNLPNDTKHRQVRLLIADRKYNVDGYDPQTKTIYEFWGDWWHGNPKKYPSEQIHRKLGKTYGELYAATMQKKRAYLAAGYNLIEIWESDFTL